MVELRRGAQLAYTSSSPIKYVISRLRCKAFAATYEVLYKLDLTLTTASTNGFSRS